MDKENKKEEEKKQEEENKKEEEIKKPKDMVVKWIGNVVICGIVHNVYVTDETVNANLGQNFIQHDKLYISKRQSAHQQLITLVHEILHSHIIEYQPDVDNTHSWGAYENVITSLDTPVTNDLILNPNNTSFFAELLTGKYCEETEE